MKKKRVNLISFCICCGARFREGTGWIDKHKFPCANHRYGWAYTTDVKPVQSKEAANA